MKILFVSNDLIAGDVAYLLVKEGHDVKLYIEEKDRRHNFDNLVPKTKDWKKELDWVGKDGLIVFDDVGYGRDQDKLRKQGYKVFGGSALGDKLELNREFGQKIFAEHGLKTVPLKDFNNLDDAVVFAKENPAPWVIKRSGGSIKFVSYVSEYEDGRDGISLLRNYLTDKSTSKLKVSLHKRVRGVEIGVARYFNGKEWVGPIEFNTEYTRFMPGDVGPTTSEMGTLAWYSEDQKNRLYRETLLKMEPYLKKIGFIGDFSLNCIVNESGAYILEATSRFGSPIVHLQSEIHSSPWGEFLYALACGKAYNLKWKKGYGIVVLLAVPPFPYSKKAKEIHYYGINIYFKDMKEGEMDHIHLEEVSLRTFENNQLYITDNRGYIAYATAVADTVEEAQLKVYGIAQKVIIPKVIYRNDIGDSFRKGDRERLETWGYL